MISFPNAKINIGLNIVSKRNDGYHNIETIFYPINLCDSLEMVESPSFSFENSGIKIDGAPEHNLVVKAYQLLKNDYNIPPVSIHLHKIIPFGAGLGGGSSDAAFALQMIKHFFQLKISKKQLANYAKTLGADCPFFITNQPVFATGIGDQLTEINLDLSAYKLLLVKPNVFVSTPQAYQNIIPAKPVKSLTDLIQLPIEEWKNFIQNDFETGVFKQFPEIAEIKETLYKMGAVYVSMSGSGSAVFGFFRHLPANSDKFLPKGIFIYR